MKFMIDRCGVRGRP